MAATALARAMRRFGTLLAARRRSDIIDAHVVICGRRSPSRSSGAIPTTSHISRAATKWRSDRRSSRLRVTRKPLVTKKTSTATVPSVENPPPTRASGSAPPFGSSADSCDTITSDAASQRMKSTLLSRLIAEVPHHRPRRVSPRSELRGSRAHHQNPTRSSRRWTPQRSAGRSSVVTKPVRTCGSQGQVETFSSTARSAERLAI